MLTQLVNKAVKGDIKAISTLFSHMLIVDAKEEDKIKVLAALNQDDKEIIALALKQLSDFDGIEAENMEEKKENA